MPTHRQHTIITWIPGSIVGQREAASLHSLYDNHSVLSNPNALTPSQLSGYMSTIVVGHRDEFNIVLYKSLHELLKKARCNWLVLANCCSGKAITKGCLGRGELTSPAQNIANTCGIKVSATTRDLSFDEVGKGYAFTLALNEVLIRSNPSTIESLWNDYEPQTGVNEITEKISNL